MNGAKGVMRGEQTRNVVGGWSEKKRNGEVELRAYNTRLRRDGSPKEESGHLKQSNVKLVKNVEG